MDISSLATRFAELNQMQLMIGGLQVLSSSLMNESNSNSCPSISMCMSRACIVAVRDSHFLPKSQVADILY